MSNANPVPASVRSLEERAERAQAQVDRLAREPNWGNGNASEPMTSRVILVSASELEPEAVEWLWPDWLARNKLHILSGSPGTGKTTIAMYFAACVSAGIPFPSGWKPPAGDVLIWSGEDDPTDTLVPRLIAAHADRSRIRFITGTRDDEGHVRPFDPAHDVDSLDLAASQLDNLSLIVIDPIVSAIAGDGHRNNEVRRGLAPLVEMAERFNAALLGITHYTKGSQGRTPLDRVTGSLAFGAAARLVFGTVCMDDGEESGTRGMRMARIKSNIGPDGGGFDYTFEQVPIPEYPGVLTSRIAWGDEVTGSARELLAEPDPEDEGNGAAAYLRELLADGPMPTKDVKRHADEAGYAWRTVQRAMKRAGVESRRGGFGEPATWSLKPSRATVAPVAPTKILGANGATEGQEPGPEGPEKLEL